MLLHSRFEELDKIFYDIDLQHFQNSNEMKTKEVHILSDSYAIKSQIYYGKHFCLINTKRDNKKQLTEYVNIQGPYVKVAYLLNGHITIFRKSAKKLSLAYGKLEIGYGKKVKNKVIVPAHKKTESILIYISLPYLVELLKKEDWRMENDFYNELLNRKEDKHSLGSFMVDHHIHHLLKGIFKYYHRGKHNSHYLELKIRELFLILQQHRKEIASETPSLHIEKIKEAKKYIDLHYKSTPTVKFLAREILLNEMQLKKDFKKIYGITIRSYIIELKMKKAVDLLKKYPVNEIPTLLGYQSISHFITTFKKFHGCTPSSMVKK